MNYKYILFFNLILISHSSCTKDNYVTTKPTIAPITESVYASGVIRAEGQYTVFSTVSGTVKSVKVTAGQSIMKGQSLFELESEKAQLSTENARLTYQLSQRNNSYIQDKIGEMELRVQAAKDKLTLDQSIYNRNKIVKDDGGISEVDFERVALAYKTSLVTYQSAQKQLRQLNAQLQNEQNRNAINLKLNRETESDFSVKSAFSGQLYDVFIKEGTFINPQIPLAIVGKADLFFLELEIDENDMVRVKVGQQAYVTMDSYKGQVFKAIVDKIYPMMKERSRTFRIEAHFENPPKKLYPNLTAEANIIIQRKEQAMTIPKGFLYDEQYVLVNKDERRKVKIGLTNYQVAEILEGLRPEETIYMSKP